MSEILFSEIFRIGDDGLYYNDGILYYKDITLKDGYHGEETYEDGKFKVVFYTKEDFTVVFPFYGDILKRPNKSEARAKCGSFSLHLLSWGIKIKQA